MKRKQIYIDEGQEAAIKRIAAERGVSEAYVIREAMAEYIREQPFEYDRNPLLDLIGIVDDPDAPTDGSINHDRDIYGVGKPRR